MVSGPNQVECLIKFGPLSGHITSVISLFWSSVSSGSGHEVMGQDQLLVIIRSGTGQVTYFTKISSASQLQVITSSGRVLKSGHFLIALGGMAMVERCTEGGKSGKERLKKLLGKENKNI